MRCFSSERDIPIVLMLIFIPIAAVFSFALIMLTTPEVYLMGKVLPFSVIAIIGIVVPIWELFNTRYVFSDKHLIIYAGPCRWKIAYAHITRVGKSRFALSSPALSMNRLCIYYKKIRKVVISPQDKSEFISMLMEKTNAFIEV